MSKENPGYGTAIPWAKPKLFGDEEGLVVDALRSTWISGGEYVTRLEREISEHTGARHAIAVSNGTTALELAFRGLRLGIGDEVIVPAFTFVAPVNIALTVGAKPVFADIDPDTWLMNPVTIENLITERTKAIVPVHLYGNVADMEQIVSLARRHGIRVIEDCAESAFSRYNNKYAGTFGDIGTFSFQATKTITTGEGGIVLTNDDEVAGHMRLLRDHGMKPGHRYWHDVVGYNFRLTNLQAAIGCAQLLHLQEIIARRKRIHVLYCNVIASISEISPQFYRHEVDPVLWAMAVRLKGAGLVDASRARRDAIMKRMSADGIETRPGFYSLDLLVPYGCPALPVARETSANVISLPTFFDLDESDITRICSSLKEAIRETE
jgi:perosamine synthetase